MRLSLSSSAAPDLALEELAAACVRRGLAAVELVAGDGHGIEPGLPAELLERRLDGLNRHGIAVAGYRLRPGDDPADPALARLAQRLRAPIVAPPGSIAPARLPQLMATYQAAGALLLLVHGSDPEEAARLRSALPGHAPEALALAWDADPGVPGFANAHSAVLQTAGDALRHIRLLGGGPEVAGREGQGIGPLMARLTLARFRGTLALAPSSPRFRVVWNAWLSQRAWGCGSKEEPLPLRLDPTPDLSGVEPR